MDKKIVIPAGLAVLVVMAVVGMLSIFNFASPNAVEASLENPTVTTVNNIGTATVNYNTTTTTMSASPTLVGDNARFTITFLTTGTIGYGNGVPAAGSTSGSAVGDGDLTPGSDEIKIRFDSSKFGVPATIDASAVTMSTTTTAFSTLSEKSDQVVNPASVTVSSTGAESDLSVITLVVPDMDPDTDGSFGIGSNATVTVVLLQSAGITLPKKAGGYDISIQTTNDGSTIWQETCPGSAINCDEIKLYRDVTLSGVSGSRGDTITATASGYSSGTATFWMDADVDGVRDSTETDLCTGSISSNVATCDFTVSNPPFAVGEGTDKDGDFSAVTTAVTTLDSTTTAANVINAVDGEGNTSEWTDQDDLDKSVFELEGSITIVPSTASPGDVVTVQVTDGTASDTIAGGASGDCRVVGVDAECSGTLSSSGIGDVSFTIPNVPAGVQKLYVDAASELDANITIVAAQLTATPTDEMVPNQRVTLSGSGFTASGTVSSITIGGETIRTARYNDGSTINIDNGGSFSTSVDIPQSAATETTGAKTIKVTDNSGRTGEMNVTIATRTMTVTPAEGRVGSNVTVKGVGFPAKNNDGSSNTVSVTYTSGSSTNTATVTPDAGGNFTTTVQVPSGAAIPSTNTVQAAYNVMVASSGADSNADNLSTETHKVPAATIEISSSSGGAGSTVTVTGAGFKRYTTVTTLEVGDIDVTPSPKPTSDTNGAISFDFVIPGTDTGVQTVELNVGGTTASKGYTVTSDIVSDVVTPTADALEPLLTAGTLASAFYFNNSTKEFDFHIVDDAFTDANTLAEVQGGEPLWIEVTTDTTAELGGTSFDLTCVNGDCFNLIVFP
jgi:hypothetical protein